jgi:hypothetical protein
MRANGRRAPGRAESSMNRIVTLAFYILLALAVAAAFVYLEAPHYMLPHKP